MLAKNEQLVKKWDYATTKDQGLFTRNVKKHSLMITNKRLIHEVKGSKSLSREEIGLKNIKSFNVFTYLGINWYGLIFIIAALPLLYFGIEAMNSWYSDDEYATMLIAGGVILIIIGIVLLFLLKKKGFILQVYTNGDTKAMNVSLLSLGKLLLSKRPMKIKVDMDQAKEIAETLGAIITSLEE